MQDLWGWSFQEITLMRYYWDTIVNCVPPETVIAAIRDAGFSEAGCDIGFDLFQAVLGARDEK